MNDLPTRTDVRVDALTVMPSERERLERRLRPPHDPDEAEITPPPLSVSARARGEHVLYVDDEEALVFLATRSLERIGYRVSGFSNARRALEAFVLGAQDFDVVVTDLTMNELSGIELTTEIRKLRPDIPVVLTSGYVCPEEAKEAASLGIREVVLKPQAAREMGRVLERVLRRVDHERP